jgi:hypothetical protein
MGGGELPFLVTSWLWSNIEIAGLAVLRIKEEWRKKLSFVCLAALCPLPH